MAEDQPPPRRPLDYEAPHPPQRLAERYTVEDEDAEGDFAAAVARRGMIGAGVILISVGVMFIVLGATCVGTTFVVIGTLCLALSGT